MMSSIQTWVQVMVIMMKCRKITTLSLLLDSRLVLDGNDGLSLLCNTGLAALPSSLKE